MSRQALTVVTGGHKGLGLAIARALAREHGHAVVVTARDSGAAHASAARLRDEGFAAHGQVLDVTSAASVDAFARWLASGPGTPDVLVNNSGIFPGDGYPLTALDVPVDEVQRYLDVNALGTLRVSQALMPAMLARGHGRVVNVGSELACLQATPWDAFPSGAAYRISKVAMHMVAQLLARAAAGTDVLVNTYSPGWVKSDIGGPDAPVTPEEGARPAVWLATLPAGGPSGRFYGEMRWSGAPVALHW